MDLSPTELYNLSDSKKQWYSQRPTCSRNTSAMEYWSDRERQKTFPHISAYVHQVGPSFLSAAGIERAFSILARFRRSIPVD
mmetsp:Transcript_6164/g.23290  ORF Transcript_6164/g.23290 Transcript_6164/m.23290 type:complete len:82 (-) Transcript_6164:79-324(-)